ncbi:hypothetical protein P3T23_009569, partial [Paraburkholderia sp. GAS448]
GIEVAHMIAKGQMKDNGARQTVAEQFYSLAAKVVLVISGVAQLAIVIATKPRCLSARVGVPSRI